MNKSSEYTESSAIVKKITLSSPNKEDTIIENVLLKDLKLTDQYSNIDFETITSSASCETDLWTFCKNNSNYLMYPSLSFNQTIEDCPVISYLYDKIEYKCKYHMTNYGHGAYFTFNEAYISEGTYMDDLPTFHAYLKLKNK